MNTKRKVIDYITEALLQLINKKNYENITITDIANRAGVTRVSFYRNFESKDDILKKHLDDVINEWNKQWKDEQNLIYQVFHFFQCNSNLIKILYMSNKQYLLIDHLLKSYGYSKDLSNAEAYSKVSVAYLIFGWCDEWYKRGMKETPEEMIKLFFQKQ